MTATLDAIAAAHRAAATKIRLLLAPLPESVLPLEAKLSATIAMAEVAAAIALARSADGAEESTPAPGPQPQCSAKRGGQRCLNAIALDKISICEGPHDFGVLPDNVVHIRLKGQ